MEKRTSQGEGSQKGYAVQRTGLVLAEPHWETEMIHLVGNYNSASNFFSGVSSKEKQTNCPTTGLKPEKEIYVIGKRKKTPQPIPQALRASVRILLSAESQVIYLCFYKRKYLSGFLGDYEINKRFHSLQIIEEMKLNAVLYKQCFEIHSTRYNGKGISFNNTKNNLLFAK